MSAHDEQEAKEMDKVAGLGSRMEQTDEQPIENLYSWLVKLHTAPTAVWEAGCAEKCPPTLYAASKSHLLQYYGDRLIL